MARSFRMALRFALFLVVPLSLAPATADAAGTRQTVAGKGAGQLPATAVKGTLLGVNVGQSTITIKPPAGAAVTVRITAATSIQSNGTSETLAQLQAGVTAVALYDPATARASYVGIYANPAPPAATPKPAPAPTATTPPAPAPRVAKVDGLLTAVNVAGGTIAVKTQNSTATFTVVRGADIRRNGAAVTLAQLALGTLALVQYDPATYKASWVRNYGDPPQPTVVEGVVTAVDVPGNTLTVKPPTGTAVTVKVTATTVIKHNEVTTPGGLQTGVTARVQYDPITRTATQVKAYGTPPQPGVLEGVITAVDAPRNTVTIQPKNGAAVTVKMTGSTVISHNGAVTTTGLRTGATVVVHYDPATGQASQVRAYTLPSQAASAGNTAPAPQPAAFSVEGKLQAPAGWHAYQIVFVRVAPGPRSAWEVYRIRPAGSRFATQLPPGTYEVSIYLRAADGALRRVERSYQVSASTREPAAETSPASTGAGAPREEENGLAAKRLVEFDVALKDEQDPTPPRAQATTVVNAREVPESVPDKNPQVPRQSATDQTPVAEKTPRPDAATLAVQGTLETSGSAHAYQVVFARVADAPRAAWEVYRVKVSGDQFKVKLPAGRYEVSVFLKSFDGALKRVERSCRVDERNQTVALACR